MTKSLTHQVAPLGLLLSSTACPGPAVHYACDTGSLGAPVPVVIKGTGTLALRSRKDPPSLPSPPPSGYWVDAFLEDNQRVTFRVSFGGQDQFQGTVQVLGTNPQRLDGCQDASCLPFLQERGVGDAGLFSFVSCPSSLNRYGFEVTAGPPANLLVPQLLLDLRVDEQPIVPLVGFQQAYSGDGGATVQTTAPDLPLRLTPQR